MDNATTSETPAANETRAAGKIKVIGIGRSGCNVVSALAGMREATNLELIVIDTDEEILNTAQADRKMLADAGWRHGAGCGGDVLKGQRSMARERGGIAGVIEDAAMLIVTGGLGGGTGTGGAPIIASVAAEKAIPTVFMMTLPFSFEGHSRLRVADDGVRELLPVADVLLCLPNDLLFSALDSDTPAEEAFKKADQEMARTVLGMSCIMQTQRLLSADFASFRSILNKKKSVCCFGIGLANSSDGLNRCHLALERMLQSPFLGSADQLKNAHAAVIIVTGGPDLQMGELKKAFEVVEKFIPGQVKLITGAATDPAFADCIQVTTVAVRYDKAEVPMVEAAPEIGSAASNSVNTIRTSANDLFSDAAEPLEQGELPLQSISKGIFVNSTPFIYNGEDLDIPTFQRKMVIIDKGD